MPVPKDWIGKSIAKMDVRKKFGINILGVKENGKMNLSVTPETVLSGDKSILVLGKQRAIEKCFRI